MVNMCKSEDSLWGVGSIGLKRSLGMVAGILSHRDIFSVL